MTIEEIVRDLVNGEDIYLKGEAFNGNSCAKIILNSQCDITVKNNVDK